MNPTSPRRPVLDRALAGLVCATVIAGTSACGGAAPPAGEEDHTHAADAVTLWTDSLELFMEVPPQVAGAAGDPWAVHLTRRNGWQPVEQGSLTLVFRGPDGSAHTFRAAAPARPGVFTPTPTLPEAGVYDLEMTLASRGVDHVIPAGEVEVFATRNDLPHAEEEAGADGGITFLKEQQWEVPFAAEEVVRRGIPTSIRTSGELVATSDAMARISAPVTGLVEARAGTPAPGTWVERGEVLAVLAPTDSDGSYARLRGRVERLEREVARAERLVEAEAIAEKRLVEARHDLSVARSALEAMGARLPDSEDGDGDYRFHLRSPIAGVVSERNLAPGQRVEAGERVFTVIDPRELWLRLRVPADDADRASDATGASFRVEGGERLHRAAAVVSVGDVIDPDSRTLPVLLRVENPDRRLKVGMLARARLFVGDTVAGPAVPADAVRDEDGMSVAYVETGGETFERRILELGPTDGAWTLVRSGVSLGERVVTRGAYQVHLASTGGGEAAAGHGHPH